ERKLLTVLFFEISADEGADPEEAQKLIEHGFELVRPILERFEGAIGRSQSDRLVAFFGAPVACEDHAQRAVHAALASKSALELYGRERRASGKGSFEFRAALNTGLAVAKIGAHRSAFNATGETVTVAARLLSLAGPAQILAIEESCKSIHDF